MSKLAKKEEQTYETPALQSKPRVRLMLETRAACRKKWTDEEIHMYECIALSSWEHM